MAKLQGFVNRTEFFPSPTTMIEVRHNHGVVTACGMLLAHAQKAGAMKLRRASTIPDMISRLVDVKSRIDATMGRAKP